VAVRNIDIGNTRLRTRLKSSFSSSIASGCKARPSSSPTPTFQTKPSPFQNLTRYNMVLAKPKITSYNEGKMGDKEFVVSCKGRPFSILTSPNFPTPSVTYIDYDLVSDLHFKMCDLQCRKLCYGGQKLRILGTISTTVQCIIDGAPAGNLQFKAFVIEDLRKLFDTHSIAGVKLSKKLLGPPFQMCADTSTDNEIETTEPTDVSASESPSLEIRKRQPKRKSKKMPYSSQICSPISPESQQSDGETGMESPNYDNKACAMLAKGWAMSPGKFAHPEIQARYDQHVAIIAQLQASGSLRPAPPYRPEPCQPPTSPQLGPAEYNDVYTNVSTIQTYPIKPGNNTPQEKRGRNVSQSTTASVNIKHGPSICNVMCDDLYPHHPEDCGYNSEWIPEDFIPCDRRCPGGWCSCIRSYSGFGDDDDETGQGT